VRSRHCGHPEPTLPQQAAYVNRSDRAEQAVDQRPRDAPLSVTGQLLAELLSSLNFGSARC
jgi:hypothetical protein